MPRPKEPAMNASMLNVVLAAALLTGADDDKPVGDAAAAFRQFAPAVRALAIRWEILDQREANYLLVDPERFEADIKALRVQYRQLRGAPPVAEADRLPSRDLINDLLAFNRTYRQDLGARLEVDALHGEDLRMAVAESEHLYRIWEAARDAKDACYYVNVRRLALQQLRELIGDRAYYTGQLPPHVPIWRMPEE
jgi:hypothetical protein